jgi:hypothetical protein
MSPRENTFFSSFAIQRRVIGALLMREIITRFGRDNLGVLWLFVEPMMFTLGVTALWTECTMAAACQLSHSPSPDIRRCSCGEIARVAASWRSRRTPICSTTAMFASLTFF